MAGESSMGDWAAALQKAQAELSRQWLDMQAAWARSTSAAGAAAAGAASAAGAAGAPAGSGATGAAGPGGGEVARRFLEQCEQYLGVSRSLWDLVGRAAAAPDGEQRARLFQEGLGLLQQQFAGLWATTPFAQPAAGAGPFGVPGGMPFFGQGAGFGAGAAAGFNPFAGWMPGGMPGMPGMGGAAASGFPGNLEALFGLPALGPGREQQQSLQRLAQLAARYAQAQYAVMQQWNDIIGKALRELGERLAPRLNSGAAPGSMKEIYDLWVDSAESVYAQAARGAGFMQAQAELTNALSQLRTAQRELVEEWSRQFDLPTRAELNSIHQQLRDLKAALQR